MPAYGDDLLALIDARVDAAAPRVTKMGSVVGRDTIGARCLVTLDGSSGVAQPVKCPESVIVSVGDRVGLVKYESDWIITVNYTLWTLTNAMNGFQWVSAQTTTSATFVDMPSSPSVEFVKNRDNTFLRIWVGLSLYATVANTVFHIGMHLASNDGAISYDEDMYHRAINEANSHRDSSGWITTGALAANSYTATARWLRTSGTGTLTTDSNDSISMHIIEVVS
jgi:hypothetical protein